MRWTPEQEKLITKLMAESDMSRSEIEACIERGFELLMSWLKEWIENELLKHRDSAWIDAGGVVKNPSSFALTNEFVVPRGAAFLKK
jgi:hypothetical protein